jgi:hypothetical protein
MLALDRIAPLQLRGLGSKLLDLVSGQTAPLAEQIPLF